MRSKKEAYVVFRGRVPGVYRTWKETNLQVDGYPGAEFRGFLRAEEAEEAWATRPATPAPNDAPAKERAAIIYRLWNLKAGTWASDLEHAEFMQAVAEKCTRVAKADPRVKELARRALVPMPVGDRTTIEQKQAAWNSRHPQYATAPNP